MDTPCTGEYYQICKGQIIIVRKKIFQYPIPMLRGYKQTHQCLYAKVWLFLTEKKAGQVLGL